MGPGLAVKGDADVTLVVIVVVCAVLGVGGYVLLQQFGLLPTEQDRARPLARPPRPPKPPKPPRPPRRPLFPLRRGGFEDLPIGCVVALLVAMLVWAALWVTVLVVTVRLFFG